MTGRGECDVDVGVAGHLPVAAVCPTVNSERTQSRWPSSQSPIHTQISNEKKQVARHQARTILRSVPSARACLQCRQASSIWQGGVEREGGREGLGGERGKDRGRGRRERERGRRRGRGEDEVKKGSMDGKKERQIER